MKYRLAQRKGRWVIQEQLPQGVQFLPDTIRVNDKKWRERASWKFRFLAALHLLILRERARR